MLFDISGLCLSQKSEILHLQRKALHEDVSKLCITIFLSQFLLCRIIYCPDSSFGIQLRLHLKQLQGSFCFASA